MERVSLADLDDATLPDGTERRSLAESLHTTEVAINHYRIEPGGGLPGGLHAHVDQEEVFVVLSGRARFETLSGDIAVEAGEAIRFPPGEFQTGRNGGEETLSILALGAPKGTDDVRVPVECPACGHGDLRLATDHPDGLRFVCPDCDAVRIPEDCPECGSAALEVAPGKNTRTITRCGDCDAEYERPPFSEPD